MRRLGDTARGGGLGDKARGGGSAEGARALVPGGWTCVHTRIWT